MTLAFIRPLRPRIWLGAALLLCAGLIGAGLAGQWALAAILMASGCGFAVAQRPAPAPPPFIGPMKRRATDFLRIGAEVTILHPSGLPDALRADLEAAQPLLDTLCGQIEGAQDDVAAGVMSVARQVEDINRLSIAQRDSIAQSLSGIDAMQGAAEAPRMIVARLSAMLAERDRTIAGNYEGLHTLSGEFQELRGALDVISQVADKAFFLAINASVEAHRQGVAGQAFGLIATEMRALATQTADGARHVSQAITSFADRMERQILAALPGSAGQNAADVYALVEELESAQTEVTAASAQLAGLIQIMEAGHRDIVLSLSDILGQLQFQDVMKQRLEQVSDALASLKGLAASSAAGTPSPRSVRDLLADQQRAYVMESQKAVLARFGGPDVPAAVSAAGAGAPKIELF